MKRWMFSSIQEVRWMHVTLAYTAWGSGSKGGLMRPASILLQLTELNQGWILTSITPCRPREHPSLLAGAFCSSPSHRDLNQDVGDEWMIYETKEGCYDASGFNSIKIFWGNKNIWSRNAAYKWYHHSDLCMMRWMSHDTHNWLLQTRWCWPWSWWESVTISFSFLLHSPVHLLSLHLLLPLSEGSSSLDHLVDQTPETEPVWTEGVLLIVNDLRGHVTNCSHATSHSLALGNLHSEAEIRNPENIWILARRNKNICKFSAATSAAVKWWFMRSNSGRKCWAF